MFQTRAEILRTTPGCRTRSEGHLPCRDGEQSPPLFRRQRASQQTGLAHLEQDTCSGRSCPNKQYPQHAHRTVTAAMIAVEHCDHDDKRHQQQHVASRCQWSLP